MTVSGDHRAGTAQADLATARALRHWYRHRQTHISLHDMQIAFRRARTAVVYAAHEPDSQNPPEPATCTATAA